VKLTSSLYPWAHFDLNTHAVDKNNSVLPSNTYHYQQQITKYFMKMTRGTNLMQQFYLLS